MNQFQKAFNKVGNLNVKKDEKIDKKSIKSPFTKKKEFSCHKFSHKRSFFSI